MLRGNLSVDGCVVETAGVDESILTFAGPAVVVESQEDACEAILSGRVLAGDVIVVRYRRRRVPRTSSRTSVMDRPSGLRYHCSTAEK